MALYALMAIRTDTTISVVLPLLVVTVMWRVVIVGNVIFIALVFFLIDSIMIAIAIRFRPSIPMINLPQRRQRISVGLIIKL